MKSKWFPVSAAAVVLLAAARVFGHCQIPCGIYDDPVRLTLMAEHIATIEKSIAEIRNISAADEPDLNQLVRWVQNKEEHAHKLTEIATFYFMAQRVKPADPAGAAAYEKYVAQLTQLHQIVVYAMKAKQSADPANVTRLRGLLESFQALYLGPGDTPAGAPTAR